MAVILPYSCSLIDINGSFDVDENDSFVQICGVQQNYFHTVNWFMGGRSIEDSKDFTLVLLQIVERFLNKKNWYHWMLRDIPAVVFSFYCNINRAALSRDSEEYYDEIEC